MRHMFVRGAVSALVVSMGQAALAQPSLQLLPKLPNGQFGNAFSVSASGNYIGGVTFMPSQEAIPTYWNQASVAGAVPKPNVAFPVAFATGITESGVVAWLANNPTGGGQSSYRSQVGGGWTALSAAPSLPETNASAISDDGSIISGTCWSQAGSQTYRAALWNEQGQVQILNAVPGYTFGSQAMNISADGKVAVGNAWKQNGPSIGARWKGSEATIITHASFNNYVEASGVDADGNTVVGYAIINGNAKAYRWTELAGTELLPLAKPNLQVTAATGVSGDGKVTVGWTGSAGGGMLSALIHSDATGSLLLTEYLQSMGVQVPAGWFLTEAHDISTDGTTIVGIARTASGDQIGFRAVVPAPSGIAMLIPGLLLTRRRRRDEAAA